MERLSTSGKIPTDRLPRVRFKIFSSRIFPVRKLKNPKKITDKRSYGPNFFGPKSALPENFGTHRFSLGGRPDNVRTCRISCILLPPLAPPAPRGGRGTMRCSRYYLYTEKHLCTPVIPQHRNLGMPSGGGGGMPEPPRASHRQVSHRRSPSIQINFSDVKLKNAHIRPQADDLPVR
jgi:hypothetical protein